MALHISYQPGEQQSHQAARYFQDTVGSLVESLVDGLEERTYHIMGGKEGSLHLRVWSPEPPSEKHLHALMDRILAVRADLQQLQKRPRDAEGLAPLAANWLSPHLAGADLFVELSITKADGAEPTPEFSMGLYRGRSVLLSTDTVLFTWLQENVFGLSVAGQGSYLLELVDGEKHALRKAS